MKARSSESERFMREAIRLSRRGYPAPNPHVGCVIVSGGEIVGRGYHDFAGGPHAEVVALADAGARAAGADVYVTLEPCNHHGRTGPCTEALISAGVRQVFVASSDPNARASGGKQRLESAGIPVQGGILAAEAAAANIFFLQAHAKRRPYVVLKAAASLDGRVALPSGQSKWITGPAARRAGHVLRAETGAVLVGSGTVLADDPELTARIPGVGNQPLRIVLDLEGRLDGSQRVFSGEPETLHVVAKGRSVSPNRLELAVKGDGFDLSELLSRLWQRGVTSLLVEGGPTTLTSFVRQRLFDRIELFLAPKLLGAGYSWLCDYGLSDLGEAMQASDLKVRKVGSDVRLTATFDV